MKSAAYLKQPSAGAHDAWAVWTRERGEFICCGEPRQLQRRGMTVLCTAAERMTQIRRHEDREAAFMRAFRTCEW